MAEDPLGQTSYLGTFTLFLFYSTTSNMSNYLIQPPQTVKFSNSTTPNMAKIISGKKGNFKNINSKKKKLCSCTRNKKDQCPQDRKCLNDDIVYQPTLAKPHATSKKRLAVHWQTFKGINTSLTALSNHIHELKNSVISFARSATLGDTNWPSLTTELRIASWNLLALLSA